MSKNKIAISIEKNILELVDSKIDGSIIRSRSQAIEFFLKKGLGTSFIDTAVILLKASHQQISLRQFKGKTLIQEQVQFLKQHSIKNIFILTEHTKNMAQLRDVLSDNSLNIQIIEKSSKGNADALYSLKSQLKNNFFVMSGDIFIDFNLGNMIKKHIEGERLATLGLMTRKESSNYGAAILDGDQIIDFQEKPKTTNTHIVNAGIYIFKPEIFELFEQATTSLEKDLLPKVARIKQLVGFFIFGEYYHLSKDSDKIMDHS